MRLGRRRRGARGRGGGSPAHMRLGRRRRGARGRGGSSPAHRPPESCSPGRRSRAGCSCRPPREQVSTPAATPAVFSHHPRGSGVVWPRAGAGGWQRAAGQSRIHTGDRAGEGGGVRASRSSEVGRRGAR
ncbi:hypothetical protein PVAP13_5NG010916 [Panicum virgatum]|uniref:Uncharacterized protein n=1 Tax=Panicum virgatum TaxID=38727 RepID=A0A8T0S8S4_PANVG|nr:hypothetical protein PVAP13_5NG010916 [Panicum virgatum]